MTNLRYINQGAVGNLPNVGLLSETVTYARERGLQIDVHASVNQMINLRES